jgi:Inner membrane protein YgaP-like, transmembrane domain
MERAIARRYHEATDMKFSRNESTADRIIRIVAGLGLAGLAIAGVVTAPVVYLALAIAAIALVTGIVGFCPLYALFHVGTRRATH